MISLFRQFISAVFVRTAVILPFTSFSRYVICEKSIRPLRSSALIAPTSQSDAAFTTRTRAASRT